jgi:hypothetical protein
MRGAGRTKLGRVFLSGNDCRVLATFGSLSYNGYDNNVSRITENVLTRFVSEKLLST